MGTKLFNPAYFTRQNVLDRNETQHIVKSQIQPYGIRTQANLLFGGCLGACNHDRRDFTSDYRAHRKEHEIDNNPHPAPTRISSVNL